MTNTSAPAAVNVHKKSAMLELVYDNGASHRLSAEYLRVFSPSAEVQGHGKGQEVLQLNKQNVEIEKLQPTGNYAIAIHFSDGHTTGIYSWSYLNHLGNDKKELWKDYCNRVQKHNNNQNFHEVSI